MNSKLNAALISGIAAGIAANLPYLDEVCCAWVIAGGVLAAYLYFKGQEPGETKQIGTGALLGLNMGLVAALVGTIVKAIVISAGIGMEHIEAELAAAEQQLAALGPEMAETWSEFTRKMSGAEGVTGSWVAVTLVVWLVSYSIVGVIGGMVGAAIFAKKQETA